MANNGYQEIKLNKGNGKVRTIHVPNPQLKSRLKQLLKIIMSMAIPAGPHIHAYVRRRNIVTNARKLQAWNDTTKTYVTPKFLLKLDIKNFFNSLQKHYVMNACAYSGIPKRIRDEIESICFVNYGGAFVLPQGSPTSPFLSNLVMREVAARIHGLLQVMNEEALYPIRFSIYCDNLSFTCDSKRVAGIVRPIELILDDYELFLNRRKLQFHSPPARKVVCGVQLNETALAPPKHYWRRLRAEIANAIIDFRAGYVPKGFRLKYEVRNEIRKNFVGRSPGVIQKILPSFVQPYISDPNNIEEVPVQEWRGKIAFIRSIDARRGQQLADQLREWESIK